MKTTKIFLIILAAAGIFATACEDLLGDLLKFDSEWYTLEFTIDPSDEVGDLVFKIEDVETNIDSVLVENGLSREYINSIKMSDAKVTILTEGYTFDPVKSVELFIETPNLASTRLAWLDTIPVGDSIIDLKLNKDDLQAYLLENKFTLTASGNLASKVEQMLDLKAEIRFLIRGDLAE
ncbi:hypothetical protein ACFLTU_05215 [Bacteroidota bacterium]